MTFQEKVSQEDILRAANWIATGTTHAEAALKLGISTRQLTRRLNPKPKRELKPCGTNAAYKRHARAGEYCPPCWDAHSKEIQRWRYKNIAASAGLQCLSCADGGQVSALRTARGKRRETVATSSRPNRLEVLMMQAEAQALRGTCSRLQVGTVIHRDGRILSTGYNGAPAGVDHCDHSCSCGQVEVSKTVGVGYCDGDCNSLKPCLTAAHAERNAIDWAARHGIALLGSELVVTDTPCAQCAGSIINAGIVSVVAKRPYRDQSGVRMLEQAGVSMSLAEDVR